MIADIRTVFVRELKPTLHDPGMMTISMVQPLVFLALFGPLAIGAGTATLQWFLPGILVMSALYGASMAGSSLLFEIQTGAHERLLVTPLKRPALLIGRALKEVVPMAFQAALLVLVTLPFGFDPSLAGIVLGLAILAVFAIGLGALSHTLALVVGKNDWVFWTIQQTVLFPVLILSGMLLATDTGPGWLRALAAADPLKYIVDAERALFSGDLTLDALYGALAALATAAVGLVVGTRTMR
jgi:ABC-2 type transport system permease protein